LSHNVTKSVTDYDSYYYCEEHNTSYPTKKSLAEEHDMDKTVVKIRIKRDES